MAKCYWRAIAKLGGLERVEFQDLTKRTEIG